MFRRPALRCIPIALVLLATSCRPASGDLVYFEDFSTTVATVTDSADVIVGSENFSPAIPRVDFGQWAVRGFGNIIDSTGEELDFSTNATQARGASVVLSSSIFTPGAGDYTVSFDISKYAGASGNGLFRLYQISNLGLLTDNKRVILDLNGGDASAGVLINGSGGGDAVLKSTYSFTANGPHQFGFTYDGTSAIGLMMGSVQGPSFSMDNISIQSVPEPSTFAFFGIAIAGFGLARKRRSKA